MKGAEVGKGNVQNPMIESAAQATDGEAPQQVVALRARDLPFDEIPGCLDIAPRGRVPYAQGKADDGGCDRARDRQWRQLTQYPHPTFKETKMYTLSTHFEELLHNVRPPKHRIELARELPPLVRSYLKQSKTFDTTPPHTALVGSYGQKMSAGDVKDVDFVVAVPGDPKSNDPEAKALIQSLRRELDGLPEYLELEGTAETDDLGIAGARRSVHVHFKGKDFHLDVVPCIASDAFDSPIWVPDRGFNKWIESHPVGVVNLIAELNAANGGKVRRLGILLKHFRNEQMKLRRPKSYWLTSLLIEFVRDKKTDMGEPIGVLFRDLVRRTRNKYLSTLANPGATPNLKDPILGHNVSWNWERSHFETFMRRLEEAERWATTALEATNRDMAIEHWKKIFGDAFPAEVEDAAKARAALLTPGASVLTGLGAPSVAGSVKTLPTTFYGG